MRHDAGRPRTGTGGREEAEPAGAMTTRQVLDGREPVRLVFEADDATMMFLCGTTDDLDDGVEVDTDRLLELDPSLSEVLQLSPGLCAHRQSGEERWEIGPREAPSELGILTSRPVAEGTEPVRVVVHDHEGDWQFVCGTTNHASDAMIVGVNHILDLDPTLEELLDLPRGTRAFREEPGDPWRHEPYKPGRRRAWVRDQLSRLRTGTRR
jgi:hypothetical protein